MNDTSGSGVTGGAGSETGGTGDDVLKHLEEAALGLLFPSETDAPFAGYRFAGAAGPEPTPEGLLKAEGRAADTHVETQEVDDLFAPVSEGDDEDARRYRSLVEKLKSELKDVRVFRVGEIDIDIFILGRAASGAWLGLKTHVVET